MVEQDHDFLGSDVGASLFRGPKTPNPKPHTPDPKLNSVESREEGLHHKL